MDTDLSQKQQFDCPYPSVLLELTSLPLGSSGLYVLNAAYKTWHSSWSKKIKIWHTLQEKSDLPVYTIKMNNFQLSLKTIQN